MSLSDQVVLMNAGRVEQAGSPEGLYADPASVFAASFVGDPPMAMIEGAALGTDGATVGIRPEHLAVVPAAVADLTVRVGDAEFLGANTHLVLEHPSARGLVAVVPGRASQVPGDTVGLALPRDCRLLFDARTGRRIEPALPDRPAVAARQGAMAARPDDLSP